MVERQDGDKSRALKQLCFFGAFMLLNLLFLIACVVGKFWELAVIFAVMLVVLFVIMWEAYTSAWPTPRVRLRLGPTLSTAQLWLAGIILYVAISIVLLLRSHSLADWLIFLALLIVLLARSLWVVKTEGWSGTNRDR